VSEAPASEVPKPRAIIQIAAISGTETGHPDVLYALADDGTVWRLAVKLNHSWSQLPALPSSGIPSPAI
jgi:hypothetical protein